MSSGSYTASMPKRYNQACPVAKSLEVVGDRWTLLVVRDLLSGPRRFQDFLGTLPGIAPNILSARLKLMEEHGLIVREFYSDRPPRAQYVLSEKGRELGMVVGALAAWGGRHVHKQNPALAVARGGAGGTCTSSPGSCTPGAGTRCRWATTVRTAGRACGARTSRSRGPDLVEELEQRAVEGLRLVPVREVAGRGEQHEARLLDLLLHHPHRLQRRVLVAADQQGGGRGFGQPLGV